MPSLSTTVTKVLEICDSPRTSPNDLNRVISLDPVLTGQVLKLINSAYYSLPNQITTLTRAIIMLGLNTVKNLALSTAVLQSLGGEDSFCALSMDDFWSHSICAGVTAKAIAALKGVTIAEREEYFVAGLLHDLGKIPLNNCFPEEYRQALELAKLEQGSLQQAEITILGIDHTAVGRMIADKWQLGGTASESMFAHHNPAAAQESMRPLLAILGLANVYANTFEIGSAGDHYPEPATVAHLLGEVKVAWTAISSLRDKVLQEIEKANIFLKVSKKS